MVPQFLKDRDVSERDVRRILPHHLKPPFETDIEREVAILEVASKKLAKLIRFDCSAANQRDKALHQLIQIKKTTKII